MEELKKDVKQEAVEPTPIQEEKQQAEAVSEDVKTPEVVDKNVYEKVREAMKSEREAKKVEQTKNAELEERLATLETAQTQPVEPVGDYDLGDAKADILFEMNRDPFIKDNMDEIYTIMSEKGLDVKQATRDVKAEIFDRIQRETSEVEPNKPLKQEKTTATQEEPAEPQSGNLIEDALAGKLENLPPDQREAIKRVMSGK